MIIVDGDEAPVVEAVNLGARLALLENGEVVAIEQFYRDGEELDEDDGLGEATSATTAASKKGLYYAIDLTAYNTVREA